MIRNRLKTPTFNDGVVRIYEVSTGKDSAPDAPAEVLTLKETLRYHERTVGLQRRYLNLQAGVNVSYVLRCQRRRNVSAQDVAVPNDGKQYRIVTVQYPEDVTPPVMDLTLEELTYSYDLA